MFSCVLLSGRIAIARIPDRFKIGGVSLLLLVIDYSPKKRGASRLPFGSVEFTLSANVRASARYEGQNQMNRIQRVLLAAAVVLLVFAALTATINFQFARAKTNTNASFTKVNGKQAGAQRAKDVGRVFLHVENRIGLGSALAWDLRRQLQEAGGFTVTLVNNDPGPDDFPLVRVAARDEKSFWTPFYAKGTVTILAKYASYTSDIALGGNKSLSFDDSTGQEIVPLVVSMEAKVENSTVGIVSFPAFRKLLVHEAAHDFAEYLRKAIDEVADGGSYRS
jgi:hypothetical protein